VPQREASGRIGFRLWQQGCAAWPDEANGLAALLLEWSTRADIYLCPYPLSGQRRDKGSAVALDKVHCDGDDGVDLGKASNIPGVCAVGSGTPGHAHVYAGLTRSVPPHQHEALCRGLGHYLGAKDPKFSDNDVLRPPGTWNFKPRADDKKAPPLPVMWLIRPTGVRIDPEELADLLGVELTDTLPTGVRRASEKSTSAGGGATAILPTDPFEIAYHPRVRRALAKVSGDRSADTMRVVRACFGAGLTEANARWAVRQRDDLAERLDQRHDDDVARCWRVCLEES